MKQKIVLSIVGVLILLGLVGAATYNKTTGDATSSKQSTVQDLPPLESKTNLDYEIIKSEDIGTIENHWLFIGPGQNKNVLASLVKQYKKDKCKKPCNVSLFDDKTAAQLDLDYKNITTAQEAENWKKKNYVFVADHLVGWSSFDTDLYVEYPQKDSYYKDLQEI